MRALATGAIPRGVILKEARLARDLDVGRGALREALSRMQGLHLLKREPNLGVRIFDFEAEVDQILTIREAIEGMAARIAAQTMSNRELDLLAAQVETDIKNAKDGTFGTSEIDDFHFLIARSTRHPRIVHLVCDDIAFQLRLAWHGAITHPGRILAATQEHAEVLAALAARDPDKAEAAMRRHIANTRNYIAAVQRHEADIRSDVPNAKLQTGPDLLVLEGDAQPRPRKRINRRGQ